MVDKIIIYRIIHRIITLYLYSILFTERKFQGIRDPRDVKDIKEDKRRIKWGWFGSR